MAAIKCKMCGGDLTLVEGQSVAECEYFGSRQTVPAADNEKKLTLFARANRLRAACEFDKAAGIYESIVANFPEEAEAYWGLVLCKYGIEYVDDPGTGKKIPTCHRSSFDSVMSDSDFEQALENADAVARKVYRDEAKQIEEIRKGIIEVSGKEEPYDIFICYKETDENGDRTLDSVLAQDIYDALTDKGYRTFFARISLEDKLGQAYEPYIFAALNSAKVMIAIGTKAEYMNAVWVKNEWSRFLAMMKKDRTKVLLPCYRDMDPYDMPEQLGVLQSYDMSKIGFIQDLTRGIAKVLDADKKPEPVKETVVVQQAVNNNVVALLKRGNMALEDRDWDKADGFFEEVLNQDAECAEAYVGKMLAAEKCGTLQMWAKRYLDHTEQVSVEHKSIPAAADHIGEMVKTCCVPGYYPENSIRDAYQMDLSYPSKVLKRKLQKTELEKVWKTHKQLSRAVRFASGALAEELTKTQKEMLSALDGRIEEAQKMEDAARQNVEQRYQAFVTATDAEVRQLHEEALVQREKHYESCVQQMGETNSVGRWENLAACFRDMQNYKDSNALEAECYRKVEAMKQEQKRIEDIQKQARKRAQKLHELRKTVDDLKQINYSLGMAINTPPKMGGFTVGLLVYGLIAITLGIVVSTFDKSGIGLVNAVFGIIALLIVNSIRKSAKKQYNKTKEENQAIIKENIAEIDRLMAKIKQLEEGAK